MEPQPLSDQLLIARVVRGDEAALATLYDRYSGLVFSVALRVTQDRAVAEEVVQDVFFSVWRSAAGFQPPGSVAAWIIGIARHRAIDATRARSFRARGREHDLALIAEPAVAHQGDEGLERWLIRDQVRSALWQLHPAQREAIELAYYGGLSQSEIAARTGAPVGTIKGRLRRGLMQMRQQLAASATGAWQG